jgi:hypothetical protein
VLLSGHLSRKLAMFVWVGLAMGTLIVLATFSRGALAVMVLGYGLVVLLSLFDRMKSRKLVMIGMMALAALPFALKMAPSIIHRFQTAPVESGLNNYSHVVNNTAYSRFIPLASDRGIVHNVYLLQASELGWAGFAAFVALVLGFFWQGGRFLVRRRGDLSTAVAGGIVVGMLVLWSQSLLEWLFRQTYITIEFFLLAGFLAALPRVSRATRRRRLKRAAVAAVILSRATPAYQPPQAVARAG